MDEKFIGIIIIILFGALPCIVLGYLIAVKQMHGLIAGWNESKVSNPVAFGKWVGFPVLVVGLCIAGTGLVWYLGLINENQMTFLLAIASVIPIPCLIVAIFKYKKRGS